MRRTSLLAALVASLQLALGAPAMAQQPAPVQPVPYTAPQPIPYSPGTAPPPAPAPAPASGSAPRGGDLDTVFLKNGGMIRGTLVEVLPNDHVTVALPSGQSALIQWTEIHHLERAGGAPGAPSPGPAAAPPTAPAPMSGPTVLVHVEASRVVTLMRRPPETGDWVTACESPCDQQMPLNNEYRIAGSGVTQSGEFTLEGEAGQRVVLKANVGTTAGLTGGLIAAGVGLLAVITGIYVVAVAAVASVASCTSNCKSNGGEVAGALFIVGGLAAIGVGGVIALSNARTGQTQEVQVRKNALADLPLAGLSPLLAPLAPAPLRVPILSGSF